MAKDAGADQQVSHSSHTPADPDVIHDQAPVPTGAPLYAPALLNDPRIHDRGNAPVRISLMRQMQQTHGNRAVQRLLAGQAAPAAPVLQRTATSARFAGDKEWEQIFAGTKTLQKGSQGLSVTKLQQALVDAGYKLPKSGVSGKFDDETETVLKQFQTAAHIGATGIFDQASLTALDAKYNTRQPYIDQAKFDPAHPDQGTRTLSPAERTAVGKALVPQRGVGGTPAVFQDDVKGEKYGAAIQTALTQLIANLHKELYADKAPLRADPAHNMHDWSVLEAPAAGAKQVTDDLYGSYAKGPKMTHAAGNFVDQWEDELQANKKLKDPDKQRKAREKVMYLINSNCDEINTRHSAVPTDAQEQVILTPIIASFVDTPAKVQTLLDLDIGWEGAQLEGTVYLQRYKQKTKEGNRTQLWELFHTCIHEYIHSLAHPQYMAYAGTLDATRYNTLVEGFDDFFTLTVRKTVSITPALQQQVEGPYFDAAAPVPAVTSGVYPSNAQAEQVVGIVGIRNAEAAYFQGRTQLIGKV